ncbi:MAG: glycosyl hydrolase family 18 protein [Crocinitomicaceae bacterium]
METKSFKLIALAIFFNLAPFISSAQGTCKEVIGYYPGWQWYDRNKLVRPETIDYDQYSIINYAFLYPLPDGQIQITDPWGDKNLLLGSINWGVAPAGYDSAYDLGNPDYHNPGTSIVHHAHMNNTDILISIGGWTLSSDFPAIAADPVKRANFAHWCNEVIRMYDVDGIDIDWEYPGYEPHNGGPADMVNYTLLLKEVRDSLDVIDQDLMLTAAFGAASDRMDDIEWNEMVATLDFINLMSYDFFGAFSPSTNHNSPLYTPAEGDPTFNCNSAIERLINDHNVPSDMINLGVAFYGRTAKTTGTPGLHVPTTGATDDGTFSADEGSPQYYNIVSNMSLFTEHWDSLAEVPYLTGNGSLNTFVSYDNEKSIGLKGQYVVDNDLAGVIIWEITGDYMESSPGSGVISGTPLADTLNLSLCNPATSGSGSSGGSGGSGGGSGGSGGSGGVGIEGGYNLSQLFLYPNPSNDMVFLNVPENANLDRVVIFNFLGEQVMNSTNIMGKIDVSQLPAGVYVVRVSVEQQLKDFKFVKN